MQELSKENKARKISILLNSEFSLALRSVQSILLISKNRSYSLSKTVNLLLLVGILSLDKLTIYEKQVIHAFDRGDDIQLHDISANEFAHIVTERS